MLTAVVLRAPYRRARGRADLAGRDHDAGPGRVFRSPGESASPATAGGPGTSAHAICQIARNRSTARPRGAREAIRPGRSRRSARRRVRPPARCASLGGRALRSKHAQLPDALAGLPVPPVAPWRGAVATSVPSAPGKVPVVVTRARASACEAPCAAVRSVRLTPVVLAGQRATSKPRTG